MREDAIRDILSGRRRGLAAALARTGLWAACWPYAAAMRIRRWAYRRGWLGSQEAPLPVICVGNLTTGGTGKTPMVAWMVRHLREMGRTVAILSRGYKAVDGRSDEAELLTHLCGAPVIIDADRVAGAQKALQAGADVAVMDDGFQHRRLRRDLDVVLLDAANPLGYGYCLPRGLLREPPAALGEAGVIVLTHSDQVNAPALRSLRERLSRWSPAPVVTAVHRPLRVIDQHGQSLPLETLAGRKVFAFCGLANPDRFFTRLGQLHARVVGTVAFDDHQPYTAPLLAQLQDQARQAGSSLMITTQKDYTKLKDLAGGQNLWQLAVEIELTEGQDVLLDKVRQAVAGRQQASCLPVR